MPNRRRRWKACFIGYLALSAMLANIARSLAASTALAPPKHRPDFFSPPTTSCLPALHEGNENQSLAFSMMRCVNDVDISTIRCALNAYHENNEITTEDARLPYNPLIADKQRLNKLFSFIRDSKANDKFSHRLAMYDEESRRMGYDNFPDVALKLALANVNNLSILSRTARLYVESTMENKTLFNDRNNPMLAQRESFHRLLANERYDIVIQLIQQYPQWIDFMTQNRRKATLANMSIAMGHFQTFNIIVENTPKDQQKETLLTPDFLGMTPAHYAALYGQVATLTQIEQITDRDCRCLRDSSGKTPDDYLGLNDQERKEILSKVLISNSIDPSRAYKARRNSIEVPGENRRLIIPYTLMRRLNLQASEAPSPHTIEFYDEPLLNQHNLLRINELISSRRPSPEKIKLITDFLQSQHGISMKQAKEIARNLFKDLRNIQQNYQPFDNDETLIDRIMAEATSQRPVNTLFS